MASKYLEVVSYNVNGIRAALNKGFADWLASNTFDIVMLQETKAQPDQIDESIFEALGYNCYWFSAQKKGYSGVGILSKQKADKVSKGFRNKFFDAEGRIIQADFGDLTFISIYLPSGSRSIRQDTKYEFMDAIQTYLSNKRKKRKKLIVSGDFNIAHQEIDIHNPKSNKNNSGFLPEERDWMTRYFESGFIDVFRKFNQEPHQYSWWSYRSGARANNKGWRLDYHTATKNLADQLVDAKILNDAVHSDHCPVYFKMKT